MSLAIPRVPQMEPSFAEESGQTSVLRKGSKQLARWVLAFFRL